MEAVVEHGATLAEKMKALDAARAAIRAVQDEAAAARTEVGGLLLLLLLLVVCVCVLGSWGGMACGGGALKKGGGCGEWVLAWKVVVEWRRNSDFDLFFPVCVSCPHLEQLQAQREAARLRGEREARAAQEMGAAK
jgi:hypothetical protein